MKSEGNIMKYKIGIDIGTTSIKAVLYGENLLRISTSFKEYKTYHDKHSYAEQDPLEVLQAFYEVMEEVIKPIGEEVKEIELLSFSSAMHSLILIGEDNELLTRSIIWSDNRAVKEVEEFKKREDWKKCYQNTGTPIHSMSPFFKLLWFREHTDLLTKTRKIIGIKEFILHHLTGEYSTDYSIASATGMLNIHSLSWDEEALQYLEIGEELLPNLIDVTEKVAVKNKEFLSGFRFSSELLIMMGASDGCLANLGSFALDKGETTITIGTSGAVRMTVDRPVLDEEGRTFCYYLMKGKWVIGGAVNNGGNVLAWLGTILMEHESSIFEELENHIESTALGSEGLLLIPYLFGERAPHWDGRLQGSFIGMSGTHGRNHFIRSALEGIVFNLREVWEMLIAISGESTVMIASGGFLNSPAWTSILSDVFGMDIEIIDSMDSSCLGAVLLDEKQPELKERMDVEKFHFSEKNHKEYEVYYKRYLWYSKKMLDLQREAEELFK